MIQPPPAGRGRGAARPRQHLALIAAPARNIARLGRATTACCSSMPGPAPMTDKVLAAMQRCSRMVRAQRSRSRLRLRRGNALVGRRSRTSRRRPSRFATSSTRTPTRITSAATRSCATPGSTFTGGNVAGNIARRRPRAPRSSRTRTCSCGMSTPTTGAGADAADALPTDAYFMDSTSSATSSTARACSSSTCRRRTPTATRSSFPRHRRDRARRLDVDRHAIRSSTSTRAAASTA